MKIKYRLWNKGIPPQPIKLKIPGWAGDHTDHKTGCTSQPWHCIPFIEGSTYGLELIYPFKAQTKVVNENGIIKFDHNFGDECTWSTEATAPFSQFAPNHYGFTSSLDILFDQENVLRLEPHPRFFTDTTGTCPIAVPGHIHAWWSRIFFVVFKSPFPGQTHIFSEGEPYAQILFVPKKANYEIEPMSSEEAANRIKVENLIADVGSNMSSHNWKDNTGHDFNDKYKQMLSAYNKDGEEGIKNLLNRAWKTKYNRKYKKIGRFVKFDETFQNEKK